MSNGEDNNNKLDDAAARVERAVKYNKFNLPEQTEKEAETHGMHKLNILLTIEK